MGNSTATQKVNKEIATYIGWKSEVDIAITPQKEFGVC